jgi:hypothetical protein
MDLKVNSLNELNPEDDGEIQIIESNNGMICPFKMKVEKCSDDGKWKAVSLNSYHNHALKRKLFKSSSSSHSEIHQAEKFFKTKHIANINLSIELQKDIETSWFEHGLKKRRII